MPKKLKSKSGARRALTRAEKTEATQHALFDAAVKVIGKSGYVDASIARITQAADVAQGTFYNYFTTQQDLFDQLLPMIGQRLIERIREKRSEHASSIDRERVRFEAFFEFLLDVPEFYRLLTEAETFAPDAHRAHTANMAAGYVRTLRRLHAEGNLKDFTDQEFEPIAYMLIGMRHYVAMRYSYSPDSVHHLPSWISDAYIKLLKGGLFTEKARNWKTKKDRGAGVKIYENNGEPRILEVRTHYAIGEVELTSESTPVAQGALSTIATTVGQAAIPGGDTSGRGVSSLSLMMVGTARRGKLVATAQASEADDNMVVNVSIHQGSATGRPIAIAIISFGQKRPVARARTVKSYKAPARQ